MGAVNLVIHFTDGKDAEYPINPDGIFDWGNVESAQISGISVHPVPVAAPIRRTLRRPLECQAYLDGAMRYPAPWSQDYIYAHPGELFEEFALVGNGDILERKIVRVVDGKDVVIWHASFAVRNLYMPVDLALVEQLALHGETTDEAA